MNTVRCAAAFLLCLFLVAPCPAQVPTDTVAGVEVYENEGSLTNQERTLLRTVDDNNIRLPEKIVVREDSTEEGSYNRWTKTVNLSTSRLGDVEGADPYLYQLEQTQGDHHAHVLAHEIGHAISPFMDAEMGRPALGVTTKSQERQAEIIGLVLGNMTFGWDHKHLGFPDRIEYPFTPTLITITLQRQYCTIIKQSWSVDSLKCTNNK